MGTRWRHRSRWGWVLLALSFASATFASRPDPTSKFYVLGLSGSAEMRSTDRIEALQGKTLHNAQGTTLTTGSSSSNTVVFSNGTAMFFAAETRIDVTKFRQSAFLPERSDLENEPSISNTEIFIPRGAVAISTPKLSPGTTLVYTTPHGLVTVHGGTVVIEVDATETRVTVTEGEATIVGDGARSGAHRLGPGEQAVARHPMGQAATLMVQPLPADTRSFINQMARASQQARQAVFFDSQPAAAAVASTTVGDPSDSTTSDDDLEAEPEAEPEDTESFAQEENPTPTEEPSPEFSFSNFASPRASGAFLETEQSTGALGVFGQSSDTAGADAGSDILFPVEVTPVQSAETPVSVSFING